MRRGNVIGTYLHGPLLPKNVWLADVLIGWPWSPTGSVPELEPLDDALEEAAHASARARRAAGLSGRRACVFAGCAAYAASARSSAWGGASAAAEPRTQVDAAPWSL